MKRIVVSDTGPLLHLSEAGAIHLLQNSGRILIPKSVTKEFNQNAQGWDPPQWIEVHKLDETAQKRSTKFIESNTLIWEKQGLLRWPSKSKRTGLSPMMQKRVD